jgi:uncharacterized protein (DUF302 family)
VNDVKKLLLIGMLCFWSVSGFAHEGLVKLKSSHDFNTTKERLETIFKEKGMTVMARVDHTANAKSVDLDLPPTFVFIIGKPQVGTRLMQCTRTVAIDLPQKILVWEKAGETWVAYNDPDYLKHRHEVEGCDKFFDKVSKVLFSFANYATK